TLTTPEALSAEFDRIRRAGYALDEQEIVQGMVCIAVPIELEGRVIAAISLVVTHKGGPVRPTAYLARLRATATEIERKLQPFSDMLQVSRPVDPFWSGRPRIHGAIPSHAP